jgi:hypothetical protein
MSSFQEHGGLRNKWDVQLFILYVDRDPYDEDERAEFGVNTHRNSSKSSDGS